MNIYTKHWGKKLSQKLVKHLSGCLAKIDVFENKKRWEISGLLNCVKYVLLKILGPIKGGMNVECRVQIFGNAECRL